MQHQGKYAATAVRKGFNYPAEAEITVMFGSTLWLGHRCMLTYESPSNSFLIMEIEAVNCTGPLNKINTSLSCKLCILSQFLKSFHIVALK